MKTLKLAVITSVILFTSGAAIADEVSNKHLSNQQFSSQRPFMKAPVQDSTYRADAQWEGATLVTEINPEDANNAQTKNQQVRMNFLAKRAY